jgi:hypothetical protein
MYGVRKVLYTRQWIIFVLYPNILGGLLTSFCPIASRSVASVPNILSDTTTEAPVVVAGHKHQQVTRPTMPTFLATTNLPERNETNAVVKQTPPNNDDGDSLRTVPITFLASIIIIISLIMIIH